jgi:hypothetical protein
MSYKLADITDCAAATSVCLGTAKFQCHKTLLALGMRKGNYVQVTKLLAVSIG